MLSEEIKSIKGDYQENLDTIEQKLNALLEEKHHAEERQTQAQAALESQELILKDMRQVLSDREEKILSLRKQLEELEARKADVLDNLSVFQEEIKETQKGLVKMEDEFIFAQQSLHQEKKNIEMMKPRIDAWMRERSQLVADSTASHALLLNRYLGKAFYGLEAAFKVDDARVRYDNRTDAFRQIRKHDSRLNDLWATRGEWQRLLSDADSENIRASARREIARIDLEFERCMPGLLEIQNPGEPVKFSTEIYYSSNDDNDTILLLPAMPEIWNKLTDGVQDQETGSIMHLIWHLSDSLKLQANQVKVRYAGDFAMLCISHDHETLKFTDQIALNLKGGSEIILNLIPLPESFQELTRYEENTI